MEMITNLNTVILMVIITQTMGHDLEKNIKQCLTPDCSLQECLELGILDPDLENTVASSTEELILSNCLNLTLKHGMFPMLNLQRITIKNVGELHIESYAFADGSISTIKIENVGMMDFQQLVFNHTKLGNLFLNNVTVGRMEKGAFGGAEIDSFQINNSGIEKFEIKDTRLNTVGNEAVCMPYGKALAERVDEQKDTIIHLRQQLAEFKSKQNESELKLSQLHAETVKLRSEMSAQRHEFVSQLETKRTESKSKLRCFMYAVTNKCWWCSDVKDASYLKYNCRVDHYDIW